MQGHRRAHPETFFSVVMEDAFITKVATSATDDGNVLQKVKMVFKKITIDYRSQGLPWARSPGGLSALVNCSWDIPAGKAAPSTGA